MHAAVWRGKKMSQLQLYASTWMNLTYILYNCMCIKFKKTGKSNDMKNWCFWTTVQKKTLESPLDSKEIKPVNPKGNQPWIFIGRTDAEPPILWPPDAKNLFTGKDPDAGKDRGQEEKRVTEDEIIGWHHWFNAHEFEQTLGDSEGQGSLACCSPWGHRVRQDWLDNNCYTLQL